MTKFKKTQAFDEFMEIIKGSEDSPLSENIQRLINGQEYLQKLHDDAFKAGFESGCDASKKVNEL